ncbi:MAG: AAA family ATPase [Deltaproteobacteria bacterium]|jgi:hypothetical protein|nr:AAA family ATPase [Deltaproteobacteria bacterium]
MIYFSRHGSFGKTFLLDGISELFQGDRELFMDLWIGAQSGYGFRRRPVLKFNMAYAKISATDDHKCTIGRKLKEMGVGHGVAVIDGLGCPFF